MTSKSRVTFTYNGKRYEVYGDTKEEAQQKKKLKLQELETGVTTIVPSGSMTLDAWFNQYIKVYKIGIGADTIKGYRNIYKNAISPMLGCIRLDNISQLECQLVLNSTKNKSGSYIRKTSILLKSLFKKAYVNRIIDFNPTEDLIMPPLNDGQRRALTPDERNEFLATTNQMGKKGLLFQVIYYCGLRPSEVYRIQGSDIDRVNRILHVRGTKTKAATRDVFIPKELVIPDLNDDTLLFLNEVGKPLEKTQLKRYWGTMSRLYRKQHGHPLANDLTPYCLRHDYCTRLQEANVPIDIARRLMGHSSIEVTSKIYTHGTEVSLNYAADLMNKYYTK